MSPTFDTNIDLRARCLWAARGPVVPGPPPLATCDAAIEGPAEQAAAACADSCSAAWVPPSFVLLVVPERELKSIQFEGGSTQ